jgi:hypothetical protein
MVDDGNDGESEGLSVSSAIESLRSELERAWREGYEQQLQFGVDQISLTLTMVASGKKGAGGKIRWWVVEAGGDVGRENSATQTMTLTLKPVFVDPKTHQTWPVQIAGTQSEPGA